MMLRQRALLQDQDRIEAARLAAERLEAAMQRPLGRPSKRRQRWEHYVDSLGGIHSQHYRVYR